MAHYLTASEAAKAIETAFAPLRCVAEPFDYEYRVRFRVFESSGQPVLTVEEIVKAHFSNVSRLVDIVTVARDRLSKEGFQLDAWQPLLKTS